MTAAAPPGPPAPLDSSVPDASAPPPPAPAPGAPIDVCAAADLPPDASRKFPLPAVPYGERMEGFVVHWRGGLYAYVNRCAHIALPLDWDDGRFLENSRRWLICQTHGALYLPDTGVCVGGPCVGRGLEPLRVEVRDGRVVVFPDAR